MTRIATNPAQAAASHQGAARAHACTHCGLPVPDGLVVDGLEHQFCCRGCESAYQIIHGCGLDAYYRLLKQSGGRNRRIDEADTDRLSVFDSNKFHEMSVRRRDDGTCTADLMLEGVHCAACVWLIERLPRIVPGLIEARLSLREGIVRVVWDPDCTRLSTIARTLTGIGYTPHPVRRDGRHELHLAQQRRMLVGIGVAGALAGNTMLLALALYAGLFGGMEDRFTELFRWLSAGLGLIALAWPGRVFFKSAWAALRTRTPHLDLPIALALGVGGAAGALNVVMGRGEIYFDSLTVLVFLLLVGRFIQYRQQRRADEAVGLLFSLTPSNCRRVSRVDGEEVIDRVPAEALSVGDLVEVRSGERVPADGRIKSGSASVIAALITGESRPVAVGVGETVCAGARVVGSTLRLRVSAVGEQTRAGRLMALVQRGVAEKPAIVALTDRAAGWFVVTVSLVALVVFAGWSTADLGPAVDHTVALLIIACPCALGLATPLTLAVAIGRAARRDILIKSGAALDRLARPGRLLIDKTGTLTHGEMRVEAWHGDESLQPIVAEIERHASHPIALALVRAYGGCELSADERAAICGVAVAPSGVAATTSRGDIAAGSLAFMRDRGVTIHDRFNELSAAAAERACTPVLVAMAGEVVAMIEVGDALRNDVPEALHLLRQWGWSIQMLTGDEPRVAHRVASVIGMRPDEVVAQVSPEQKLGFVRSLRGTEPVLMVGDGVNDAAAIAAADVGIAVSGGAEASLAAADVYLAQPGISGLVDLIATARKTRRIIRRCLALSLAYNAAGITLAAAGLIGPLAAAVLMPLSSSAVLALAISGGIRRPASQTRREPTP